MLGKAKFDTPCGVRFTHYVKDKRTDPDNISSMVKKVCLDAMQKANIIENDSLKHITHFEDRFVISNKVGVKIERLDPISIENKGDYHGNMV
jgi:Holliday junction resolvase RusA-like endonuclease